MLKPLLARTWRLTNGKQTGTHTQREKIAYRGCDKVHFFDWEHKTKRLDTDEKAEAREFLAERDGLSCQECGVVYPKAQDYTIDHTKKWRDEHGHIMYDNHVDTQRLVCHPCNTRIQHRERTATSSLRERAVARDVAPNASEEIIRHDEGVPVVTRLLIERIQEGWKSRLAIRKNHQGERPGIDYVPLNQLPEYRDAVDRLKLKEIVGSIIQDTGISGQAIYHYLRGCRNKINGWLYEVDTEDGKLLDFKDPENHRRPKEEVYRMVKPGKRR